jgi:hypothetical protein
MTNSLLPVSLPISLAAVIAGVSPVTFNRHILPALQTNERGRVLTQSLQQNLDKVISPEEFLQAERKRDGAREYQRKYRRHGPGAAR